MGVHVPVLEQRLRREFHIVRTQFKLAALWNSDGVSLPLWQEASGLGLENWG